MILAILAAAQGHAFVTCLRSSTHASGWRLQDISCGRYDSSVCARLLMLLQHAACEVRFPHKVSSDLFRLQHSLKPAHACMRTRL